MDVFSRVKFEKVVFSKLNAKDYCYVDMHTHTNYSDAYTRVKAIIRKAKRNRFGVAITDHNEIRGAKEAYANKEDVLIVPGIELGVKEGPHVLLYFYHMSDLEDFHARHVQPFRGRDPVHNTKLKLPMLFERAEKYSCLIVPAHPTIYSYLNFSSLLEQQKLPGDPLKRITAFEVLSGHCLRMMNQKACWMAQALEKGFIGGSDAHTLSAVGSVLTYAPCTDLDGFLEAIRKKQNFIIGKELRLLRALDSYSRIFLKRIRHLHGSTSNYYRLFSGELKKRFPGAFRGKQ